MTAFEPKVILCPTDFSQPAILALRYASHLADCFSARLIVLHADVFEAPIYFTESNMDQIAKVLEQSKGAAHSYLVAHVKGQIGQSSEFEPLVVEGDAVSTILETSEEKKTDLTVMGSHGRSGFNQFMLGSITEKVLHETDRPLLMVPETKGQLTGAQLFIRRVLCPVNYSDIAYKALQHAVSISRCFGAEVIALHINENQSDNIKETGEHDRLCAWIPSELRSECSIKEWVRQGDAAEQIIHTATSEGCDLIVLGAQHKKFRETTVLGTTTLKVTRHSSCPVLVITQR